MYFNKQEYKYDGSKNNGCAFITAFDEEKTE
jgi:hypothetical protein